VHYVQIQKRGRALFRIYVTDFSNASELHNYQTSQHNRYIRAAHSSLTQVRTAHEPNLLPFSSGERGLRRRGSDHCQTEEAVERGGVPADGGGEVAPGGQEGGEADDPDVPPERGGRALRGVQRGGGAPPLPSPGQMAHRSRADTRARGEGSANGGGKGRPGNRRWSGEGMEGVRSALRAPNAIRV